MVNAADTTPCRHELNTITGVSGLAPKWVKMAPKLTNPELFQTTRQYILILDLFHLRPIGPTLEPTLTSLPDTRNQYYVSVNYGLGFRVPVGLDLQDSFKTKKVLNQTSHPTVYACVTNDLFGNDITCVLLTSNNSSFVQFELFL